MEDGRTSGLWEKRVADAILAAEKPAALARMRELPAFKRTAAKAIKQHRLFFDSVIGRNRTHEFFTIAGAWRGNQDSVSVVMLPSLERYHEAEKALAALGSLLGDRLGGLSFNMGPVCPLGTLIWCDGNREKWDIRGEDDLVALLLDLRTEQAEGARFLEVMGALRAGGLPARPI